MRGRIRTGAVILLDDAAREGEKAIVARWADKFGAAHSVRGTAKPYYEIRV
jgi:hypothetical protein